MERKIRRLLELQDKSFRSLFLLVSTASENLTQTRILIQQGGDGGQIFEECLSRTVESLIEIRDIVQQTLKELNTR